MVFKLEFISDQQIINEELACYGRITIGEDLNERFIAALTYWSQEDYLAQWKEGLKRIIQQGLPSALITYMRDPAKTSFIEWWTLYQEGKTIYIHNQLLFMKDLKEAFNLQNPYVHIVDRQEVDEEGNRISEWQVPLEEIQDFSNKLK